MTDYTRMIHDFVDGTLDHAAESELFASISANESLRAELKEQLAIKNAVRNDTMAYTPAADSTVKIFSTLGFHTTAAAVGGAALGSAAVRSSGGFLSAFSGKVAASIMTGLVSALLTAAVIFSVLPGSDESSINARKANLVSPTNSDVAGTIVNREYQAEVAMSAFVGSTLNNNEKSNNQTVANSNSNDIITPLLRQESTDVETSNSLAISDNNKHNPFSDVAEGNESQAVLARISPTDVNSPNRQIAFSDYEASEHQTVGLPLADNNLDDMLIISNLTPWSVEFRGNDDIQLHKETVMPDQHSPFNNSTIGVYYALNDQFSLGIEYRRENFMQKFNETDANGIITTYEQQPNFNSYGAAVRYMPEFARIESWDMQTITQLSAGMTFSGKNSAFNSIGRLMIAEKYAPYPELAFIVGLEGSMLAYKHENTMFRDYKLGFFYGIEINL